MANFRPIELLQVCLNQLIYIVLGLSKRAKFKSAIVINQMAFLFGCILKNTKFPFLFLQVVRPTECVKKMFKSITYCAYCVI